MIWALGALAIVAGIVAFGVGVIAASDPEGRGGNLLLLIPLGGIFVIAGIVTLCFKTGRHFGWW